MGKLPLHFGRLTSNSVETLVQQLYQGATGPSTPLTTRTLRRGQHLFRPGDLLKHVYSINRGMVKTYTVADNVGERITGFHSVGTLLGMETLTDRPLRCGAVALDTTLVCQIPVPAIVVGSGESRQLRLQLIEQFDNEIARLEARLAVYSQSASQRLANFILSTANQSSETYLPMSHKEIGNYLGIVPETVCRLLAKFQRRGWLTTRWHHVTIRDRLALQQVAAGSAPPSKVKATSVA